MLKEELSCVDAYIKLALDGRSVHDIIRENEAFEHKNNKLKNELEAFKLFHKTTLAAEKEKERRCRRLLRVQQEKVVKPMVLEIAVKDQLN